MLNRSEIVKIISRQRSGLTANAVRFCLYCLTPIYRIAVHLRNRKFDRAINNGDNKIVRRAGVPVISVGNLTTGGTGKTPLVIWIASYLKQQNLRVTLISRGYGSDQPSGGQNDEALELEHRLPDVPHLQDPDRFRMTQMAVKKFDAQIVVLDDAFQHRQLHRDLDIVLIDASVPFGYGYLLPRGLLREPISSLARADIIILTRTDLVTANQLSETTAKIRSHASRCPIAEVRSIATDLLQYDGQRAALNIIKDQPVFSFCGIGNPDSFAKSLAQLGFDVRDSAVFDDHHNYTHNDLEIIGPMATACGASAIICTHKDLVKVGTNELAGLPVYAVIIEQAFVAGQTGFENLLNGICEPKPTT